MKEEILKFFKENPVGLIVVEVPLLYESKMDNLFDVIIGVEAPEKKQRKLLEDRNKQTSVDLRKINESSQYDENKKKADFIIINDVDLKSLSNKTNKIISKLKCRLD